MLRFIWYIICLNGVYLISRVIIPPITLASCSAVQDGDRQCRDLANQCISILILVDFVYMACLLLYIISCALRLLYFTWNYSRLEAHHHMNFLVCNSLGMIIG